MSADSVDPMVAFVVAEIHAFRMARLSSPVVERCLQMTALCTMPDQYAWLMAAMMLLDENDRLRRQLIEAITIQIL